MTKALEEKPHRFLGLATLTIKEVERFFKSISSNSFGAGSNSGFVSYRI
jgi:hypothetical protein